MPSPFPGMDPYLEDTFVWPGVHHVLITEIQNQLSDELDPRYFVNIEERLYVMPVDDLDRQLVIPDVTIHSVDRLMPRRATKAAAGSATAIAVMERDTLSIREYFLTVTDPKNHSVPVAVIELLSPGNKIPGPGRRKYMKKRRLTMRSKTHLVEIDLLRGGAPTMPVSAKHPSDYRVYVSDARTRPQGLLWPVQIEERLPDVTVPLLKKETVDIKLQDALNLIYSKAKYASKTKYDRPCVPPLTPAQAKWAKSLLKDPRRAS